jgi:monoamine oxidase
VLAIPLTLQRALRFDPPLPAHRRLALQRAVYGEVVKAASSFERIAWPQPFAAVTENGVVYEPQPRKPLAAVFAGAAAAGREPRDALRSAGVEAQPRRCVSVDWTRERFTRGSCLIFGPGDLLEWGGGLRNRTGVPFAGAEASALPSYLEGAIRAGERVAAETTSLDTGG